MNIVDALDKICKLKTRKETRDFYRSLPRELQEDTLVINTLRKIRAELFWESLWVRFYRWWLRTL
jgi:hypothetical protein